MPLWHHDTRLHVRNSGNRAVASIKALIIRGIIAKYKKSTLLPVSFMVSNNLYFPSSTLLQAPLYEPLKHVLRRPGLVEGHHVAGVADEEEAEVAGGFEVAERGQ